MEPKPDFCIKMDGCSWGSHSVLLFGSREKFVKSQMASPYIFADKDTATREAMLGHVWDIASPPGKKVKKK